LISDARNAVLNNTVADGMMVTGGKKEGWNNPDSTARNAFNMRSNDLSIQEIVDSVLNKKPFGFDGYNPKAVVRDLLPVKTHLKNKSKRRMFCEEASREKDKIPAPSKYQSAIDWTKDPETRTLKFLKDPRKTVADEIIHKSKNPAKCSPGPAGHDTFDAWKYTLQKVPGASKV